jgi:hypothetical protein
MATVSEEAILACLRASAVFAATYAAVLAGGSRQVVAAAVSAAARAQGGNQDVPAALRRRLDAIGEELVCRDTISEKAGLDFSHAQPARRWLAGVDVALSEDYGEVVKARNLAAHRGTRRGGRRRRRAAQSAAEVSTAEEEDAAEAAAASPGSDSDEKISQAASASAGTEQIAEQAFTALADQEGQGLGEDGSEPVTKYQQAQKELDMLHRTFGLLDGGGSGPEFSALRRRASQLQRLLAGAPAA